MSRYDVERRIVLKALKKELGRTGTVRIPYVLIVTFIGIVGLVLGANYAEDLRVSLFNSGLPAHDVWVVMQNFTVKHSMITLCVGIGFATITAILWNLVATMYLWFTYKPKEDKELLLTLRSDNDRKYGEDIV